MRRLLIASQKCGVGKTTTSMNLAAAAAANGTRVLLLDADPLSNISTALNLAQHPQRRLLRQDGIDLPGALVANLIPGLDVLSPYDAGLCTDEDFTRLLQALDTSPAQQGYCCIIIDSAPFLGNSAPALLAFCDDYLLVMRAETMADRTLPAFLELVQRSSCGGHALPMRGILLTLPAEEESGCRLERELRGRFGTRLLEEAIPHDESIVADLRVGHIGSHQHPDSPAGRQYHKLAAKLGLAAEPVPALEVEQILQALREAAETIGPSANPEATIEESIPAIPGSSPLTARDTPTHRPRRLSRSSESLRPVRSERAAASAANPAGDSAGNVRMRDAQALAQLWPLWILLGAVLGGGLRLLPLSPSLLPFLIGVGVALLVAATLYVLAVQRRKGAATASKKRGWLRRRETKKISPRAETRQDFLSARLASLANNSRQPRDKDEEN